MSHKIQEFSNGTVLKYEYDFGDTTRKIDKNQISDGMQYPIAFHAGVAEWQTRWS